MAPFELEAVESAATVFCSVHRKLASAFFNAYQRSQIDRDIPLWTFVEWCEKTFVIGIDAVALCVLAV